MTNAGLPITIDGKEYQLTQLGQQDWDYLVNAMRSEFIRMGKSAGDDMQEVRMQAFKLWRPDLTDWLSTLSGVAHLLFTMLRHKYGHITIEQCIEWIEKQLIDQQAITDTLLMSVPKPKDGAAQPGNE